MGEFPEKHGYEDLVRWATMGANMLVHNSSNPEWKENIRNCLIGDIMNKIIITTVLFISTSISGCFANIADLDDDGIRDELDDDIDGDGWSNIEEKECGTNSTLFSSVPEDKDSDGVCDKLDPDLYGALRNFRYMGENRDFLIYSGQNKESYALNMTTWQLDNGGWEKWKEKEYQEPWDGVTQRTYYLSEGKEVGSLADQATTAEIRYIAGVYANTDDFENKSIFKESVLKGVEFVLDAQHDSGGWPQIHPSRDCSSSGCNYTSLMTYNDFVIQNSIFLLWDILEKERPFDSGILDDLDMERVDSALRRGLEYVLKSQVVVEGKLTIWGQQHDPLTYNPMPGRYYELACRTAAESVGTTLILLNWENRTPEIRNATWGAVSWFEENMVTGLWYNQVEGEFEELEGSIIWYRFYNVSDNQYFMADRDGVKVYNIEKLSEERRKGYLWASNWGLEMILETRKIEISNRT